MTVFEALKAYDQLKAAGTSIRVIDLYSLAPVDADGLVAAARATGGRLITVEDHYAAGGIGDAVAEAVADAGFTVHRLAVREIPRSGKPEELLDRFGISASAHRQLPSARSMVAASADLRLQLLQLRSSAPAVSICKTSACACARATAMSASTAATSALFCADQPPRRPRRRSRPR